MVRGKVYLIGAGPGDPGLITVKGLERLRGADVVVYDYLASPRLLAQARPGARLIYVGKQAGRHSLSQEEINQLLIAEASEGKVVARLKGGDPFIFGRGGEEAEVLAAAGVPFEVIPGVSSATAVPAYAGIPLTHRRYTSSVAFITGHEDPAKEDSSIDWPKLATGAGTLVFLMGMAQLPKIVDRLLEHGRSRETPAALIRWGTLAEQETWVGNLGSLREELNRREFKPPAILVVGEVVRLRERLNWFESKPLFGKRILVTRSREQASAFAELLEAYGAEVLEFPTIEILPPESWEGLDAAIGRLTNYHWIIFTSANGVEFFMRRLSFHGRDVRELKGIRICAIGPATAEALGKWGLRADLLPSEYRAEAILEGLAAIAIKGQRFLLPRAQGARDVLPKEISRRGGEIDVVTAYRTVKAGVDPQRVKELLGEGKIHAITFTSSSTVTNFLDLLNGENIKDLLQGVTIASIGPITAEAARQQGIKTDIQPTQYTIPALAEAIVDYFRKD